MDREKTEGERVPARLPAWSARALPLPPATASSAAAGPALAAYLERRGVPVGPWGRLSLGPGPGGTCGGAAAAGLTAGHLALVHRPDALLAAVAAVLDGTVQPYDVWWAAANGWERCGAPARDLEAHRLVHHRWLRQPTPADALGRHLAAFAALRPLLDDGDRSFVCSCGLLSGGRRVVDMARQAVARLGEDAASWILAWRKGSPAPTARSSRPGYVSWLEQVAVPWRWAAPVGHDPQRWALRDAAAWHNAGFAPGEAEALASLPPGDPSVPSLDQLRTMAALRGL